MEQVEEDYSQCGESYYDETPEGEHSAGLMTVHESSSDAESQGSVMVKIPVSHGMNFGKELNKMKRLSNKNQTAINVTKPLRDSPDQPPSPGLNKEP